MRKTIIVCGLTLAVTGSAFASDRVIQYPQQNQSSMQQSLVQRYPRVTEGNFARDAFGKVLSGGSYTNMTINPNGGLFVDVAPTTSNYAGTLYQLGQNDANPMPVNVSPQLNADPTVIMIEGQLASASSSIGPISVPGSAGQSQYTLIEAQIQSVDQTPAQELFINTAGGKYFQTVNTDRQDQVVFQAKAGTASSSPVAPTADAGWIPIGTILVPYGTSTITSGMISQVTPFAGFTQIETSNALALAGTSTVNFYTGNQRYLYYTSNATGNFTINVAYSPSATFGSASAIGTVQTINFLNTNGTTAYYCNGFTIDGTSTGVSMLWQGGTAPTSGNASTVDLYTFKIIKTGNSTYSVLASQSKY